MKEIFNWFIWIFVGDWFVDLFDYSEIERGVLGDTIMGICGACATQVVGLWIFLIIYGLIRYLF